MLAPILPLRLRISPARAVTASLIDEAIDAPPGIHLKNSEDMNYAAEIAVRR